MTLDQCLGANRPLVFVTCESDVEVLRHILKNYPDNDTLVYSSTIASLQSLSNYMNPKSSQHAQDEAMSTLQTLDRILTSHGHRMNPGKRSAGFTTYIFLDCDMWIHDAQNVRKVKDILHKYTIDEEFTVNLIMLSGKVCVPMALERLAEMVNFDLPSDKELKDLSDNLAKKLELAGKEAPSEEVINNLKGMTLFEVEQSYLQSHYLFKKVQLDFIRDFKKNAIAKTDLLSLLDTSATFDDIGGLDKLKQWVIKSAGGWTVDGKKFGLPLLKGVLLVGLPGCGKSLSAKALGNQWSLPVVDFDPSRVFSSRVGDSETNMRRVLQIVENLSPCIMMIDEIEKGLAGLQSSSYSDSGVTARVIRSFLVWMQECKKPVFTVATANNISNLPPEMISRFDEVFFVNLPQIKERKDIFNIHIKKLGRDPKNFDINALAEASQDLSGREIEQVLKEAMYSCFHDNIDLKTDAVLHALKHKTTLVTTMAEQLKNIIKWVGWDPEKQDGLRARYASITNIEDVNRVQTEIDALLKEIESGPMPGDDNGATPA